MSTLPFSVVMVDDVNEELDQLDWHRLGDMIRTRRLELDMSQEELAHKAKVSAKKISEYEKGLQPTGRYPYKVQAVIHALGWSAGSDLDILRGGEPTGRLDQVTDASDQDSDLVFIMRNVHEAGPRTLKALRAVLESDLQRDEE